jgi:hypothetical protein
VIAMKSTVLLVTSALVFGLASDAQAAIDAPTVARALGISPHAAEVEAQSAARVMEVSDEKAAEDLVVQHEAFHTIGKLMEAGDTVWFDNRSATVHVHGPAVAVAIPSSLDGHIVHDAQEPSLSAPTTVAKAASCGTSRSTEEFCTPVEAGEKIKHVIGGGGPSGYCTAGFMVRDYSGNPYILTAAHCTIWGTTFYENPFTSKTWPGLAKCELTPWVHGVSPWSGYDAAIIPLAGCGGMIPYLHNWETGVDTHQEGATNTPFVGEYVCHWGLSVKSLHACGTERSVDVPSNINYEETGSGVWTIQHTDVVCGYVVGGDSGGPVTDGTYTGDATGTVLAAGPDSTCGSTKTFWIEQRIFASLGLFNVYVAAS